MAMEEGQVGEVCRVAKLAATTSGPSPGTALQAAEQAAESRDGGPPQEPLVPAVGVFIVHGGGGAPGEKGFAISVLGGGGPADAGRNR